MTTQPPAFGDWAVEKAAHIKAPALLLRGAESDVVDDAGVAPLQQLIPQAEVLNVAAAGRVLVADRNDTFNAGLPAHIKRHMPPGRISPNRTLMLRWIRPN